MVGTNMMRRDILRSIFFPSESVAPKYEATIVTTKDDKTIRGLLVSEDGQNVVLKTAEEVEPVSVPKSQIVKRGKETVSVMPDDLADKIGDAAIRDVTVYLIGGTIKK
jgi:putative heme-binding domain-containing protein